MAFFPVLSTPFPTMTGSIITSSPAASQSSEPCIRSEEKRKHEFHIRFKGYAARVVGERQWHSTQAVRKLKPDGSVIEFEADLSGLEEITRWVLSLGSKAQVLGPPELMQRVREELGKMVQASE